jgi:hypothetical protein
MIKRIKLIRIGHDLSESIHHFSSNNGIICRKSSGLVLSIMIGEPIDHYHDRENFVEKV